MYLIHNPTAGQRNARRLQAVLAAFARHGAPVELLETRHPGHAAELARNACEAGASLIVAAGGDGTIAETVGGILAAGAPGHKVRLGVVPLGTANVLAHEYGLPDRPDAIARALTGQASAPLWPGLMQMGGRERAFVQMVGAGFDAHVVHRVDLGVKRRFGRGAYVWQTLRELPRYGFAPMRVRVDGVVHEVASAIISKGRLYGGPYLLSADARPGEAGFSVTLFREGGVVGALRAGAALPRGRLGSVRGAISLHAREIEIEASAAVPVQADGDAAGHLPLRIVDAAAPIALMTGGR